MVILIKIRVMGDYIYESDFDYKLIAVYFLFLGDYIYEKYLKINRIF
jgi:hypothetical protein